MTEVRRVKAESPRVMEMTEMEIDALADGEWNRMMAVISLISLYFSNRDNITAWSKG